MEVAESNMSIQDRNEQLIITPICSVLGHVDVGKTKLLDYLRSTHTKEVSGITQQIGTTVFDKESLLALCGKLGNDLEIDKLIMIDTPGHSNFTTMRQVGAVISNLVIVVVDINKGLEEETKRCLKFVKENHDTNFVIALNKLDRIYGWESIPQAPLKRTFNKNKAVMETVKTNINRIICQLAELEINACAYYDNKDLSTFVSMIPISAQTGEGIPDLMLVISKMMVRATKKLEARPISQYTFGYFLDKRFEERVGNFNVSININGTLCNGDRLIIVDRDDRNIVIEGVVKNLVASSEGKEMKDKSRYKTIQRVEGTTGLGIFLNDDIQCSPGSIYAVTTGHSSEEVEEIIKLAQDTISCTSSNLMCQYDKKQYGVFLYAPSLNIISALISIMNDNKIPIIDHCVGRLTRQTIIKLNGVYERMDVEHEINYVQRYKTILVFNPVAEKENPLDGIEKNVIDMCKQNKITIIGEKTVFKLLEKYTEFVGVCDTKFHNKYKNVGESFQLKILPEYVFLKTTPLLFGVRVVKGQFKVGTLVCAVKGDTNLKLGNITSIQKNKKSVDTMKVGDELCIRIESSDGKLTYGEDFDETFEIQRYITDEERLVIKFIESLM